MPAAPIKVPWTMNIHRISRAAEPIERRIAMSPRLSRTTITKVDTILNAATTTTNSRITKIIDLVS